MKNSHDAALKSTNKKKPEFLLIYDLINLSNHKKEWKSNCIKELNTIILQMNELDQPALNTLVNTATEQAQLQLLKNILVI